MISKNSKINLELILTRRNTFGPLHQIPIHTPSYGPLNFITEGDQFSEEYKLIPSGLLTSPQIRRAYSYQQSQVKTNME